MAAIASFEELGIHKELFEVIDPKVDEGIEITLKVTVEKKTNNPLKPYEVTEVSKMVPKINKAKYVHFLCIEIAEVFSQPDDPQYGLFFWNEFDLTKCKWLDRSRTLRYYDVNNMDHVIYRNVNRPQKVQLMDGSLKNIVINDTLTITGIVELICKHQNISNPEEFSLKMINVDETEDDEARRVKASKDEGHAEQDWLDPKRTLHEQNIPKTSVLLLKKKFFYHEDRIDTADPTTLNLLFSQLRADIFSGTLPTKLDEAVDFAALNCLIVLGPHNPATHKPGKVAVKDFISPEFRKEKKIDERILKAHSKMPPMDVQAIKFRFVKLARAIKTFGVTVFHVKVPTKDPKTGKPSKVMQPLLLGVSRSHILRLDPISKDEVGEAKGLTHLKHWQPAANKITLDFGDEAYWEFFTDEGKKIDSIISGYIDIILAQRRDKRGDGDDDGDGSAAVQDGTGPQKAMLIKKGGKKKDQPTELLKVKRPEMLNDSRHGDESLPPGSDGGPVALATLAADLNNAAAHMNDQPSLSEVPPPPGCIPNGEDDRLQRLANARDHLASILGDLGCAASDLATAGCVSDPSKLQKEQMQKATQRMLSLSDELMEAAKMNSELAGAQEDKTALEEPLKEFNKATGKVFQLAHNAANKMELGDDGWKQAMDDLRSGLKDMGEDMMGLLVAAKCPDVAPMSMKDLLSAADALGKALGDMNGVHFSDRVTDAAAKQKLDNAQRKVEDATRAMMTSVDVAGPAVLEDANQAKLQNQGAALDNALKELAACQDIAGLDAGTMDLLREASKKLSDALAALTDSVKTSSTKQDRTAEIQKQTEKVDKSIAKLMNADNDTKALSSVRDVTESANELGLLADAEAKDEVDTKLHDQLLAAAGDLAKACASLAEAAKKAKGKEEDDGGKAMQKVKEKAAAVAEKAHKVEELRSTHRALQDLAAEAKKVAELTDNVNTAVGEMGETRSPALAKALTRASDEAKPAAAELQRAALRYSAEPSNPEYQKGLLQTSKEFFQPQDKLTFASRSVSSKIVDPAQQQNVENATTALLQEKPVFADKVNKAREACWGVDVDAANDEIKAAKSELSKTATKAADGKLKAEETQSSASTAVEMSDAIRSTQETGDKLVAALEHAKPDEVAAASQEAASRSRQIVSAATGVAATSGDKDTKKQVLKNAEAVVAAMEDLVDATKKGMQSPSDAAQAKEVQSKNKKLKKACAKLNESMPGQNDCVDAETKIKGVDLALLPDPDPKATTETDNDLLAAAARALADALNKLSTGALSSPEDLAVAAKDVRKKYVALADTAKHAAANSAKLQPASGASKTIMSNLESTRDGVIDCLEAARKVSADDQNDALPKEMSDKKKETQAIISELGSALQSGPTDEAPSELDGASATVSAAADRLDVKKLPAASGSFEEHLNNMIANAQAVQDSSAKVGEAAKTAPAEVPRKAASLAPKADALSATAVLAAAAMPGGGGDAGSGGDLSAQVEEVNKSSGKLAGALQTKEKVAKRAVDLAQKAQALHDAAAASGAPADKVADLKSAIGKFSKDVAANCGDGESAPSDEGCQALLGRAGKLVKAAQALGGGSGAAGGSVGGPKAQAELVSNAKDVVKAVAAQLNAAKGIESGRPDAKAVMLASQRAVQKAVAKLLDGARGSAPGQKECTAAINEVQTAEEQLAAALVAAQEGDLVVRDGLTYQTCQANLGKCVKAINKASEATAQSAMGDAPKMGESATVLAAQMANLVKYAKGVAGTTQDPEKGAKLLQHAVSLTQDLQMLLKASKDAGGSDKSKSANKALAAALGDIGKNCEAIKADISGEEVGAEQSCDSAIATIGSAVDKNLGPSAKAPKTEGLKFEEHQDIVDKQAKALANMLGKLSKVAKKDPRGIPELARDIADLFPDMLQAVAAAAQSSSSADKLRDAGKDLASEVQTLIGQAKDVQANPTDDERKALLQKNANGSVARAIQNLMVAAKAPPTSQRNAEAAVEAIDENVHALETLQLLASSGQVKAKEGESYATYSPHVAKAVKHINSALAKTVEAVNGTPEDVAGSAQKIAAGTQELADVLKLALCSLPDLGLQNDLLDAARLLAEALSDMTSAAIARNENKTDKATEKQLKKALAAASGAVEKMTATSASVEENAGKGGRAVESSMEAIQRALATLDSAPPPAGAKATVTPEQIGDETRAVANAAQKLINHANKGTPEKVEKSCTDTARAVCQLIERSKGAAVEAPAEARKEFYDSVATGVSTLLAILDVLKKASGSVKGNRSAEKQLRSLTGDLVEGLARMEQGANLLEPGDAMPKELMAAASSIDADLKKLESLKLPKSAGGEMSFEEQMVAACKAILQSSETLVKAAAICQREISQKQAGGTAEEKKMYNTDGDFQAGLISAAQQAAAQCRQLTTVAGEVVKKQHKEPHLVLQAAAKGISAATVHLLTAGQVKAGLMSKPQQNLQKSGKEVGAATQSLLTVAENERIRQGGADEEDDVELAESAVKRNKQQIEAENEVRKLQEMLDAARKGVTDKNRARYAGRK